MLLLIVPWYFSAFLLSRAQQIITYPSIDAFDTSTLFSITANTIPINVPVIASYHTSFFSATPDSTITIEVMFHSGLINLFSLAPPVDKGNATVIGNTLTFTVKSPIKVEIRFNTAVTTFGDTPASTVMYLIVDLPEIASQIPSPFDPTVLYFGAGIHNLGFMLYNATNPPPSQIYAAPGALVNAAWPFVGVSGVVVSGRGVFRNPFQDKSQTMLYFSGSQDIIIRDLFIVDSPQHVIALSSGSSGNSICSHFLIDNIKSLHRGGNSDGFSFFGPVNEVLVQNVLLVNVDNQIVFQAGLPTGPHNNTFQNNIFVKSSSGGNFLVLQTPSASAFGVKANKFGTIGSGNLLTSFDILRLSGSTAFVQCEGANTVDNLVLDNIRIVSFRARLGGADQNLFLDLSSQDTQFQKSIVISNSQLPSFPLGFNGSIISGNWMISFQNVSVGGVPLVDDNQIGFLNSESSVVAKYN